MSLDVRSAPELDDFVDLRVLLEGFRLSPSVLNIDIHFCELVRRVVSMRFLVWLLGVHSASCCFLRHESYVTVTERKRNHIKRMRKLLCISSSLAVLPTGTGGCSRSLCQGLIRKVNWESLAFYSIYTL